MNSEYQPPPPHTHTSRPSAITWRVKSVYYYEAHFLEFGKLKEEGESWAKCNNVIAFLPRSQKQISEKFVCIYADLFCSRLFYQSNL